MKKLLAAILVMFTLASTTVSADWQFEDIRYERGCNEIKFQHKQVPNDPMYKPIVRQQLRFGIVGNNTAIITIEDYDFTEVVFDNLEENTKYWFATDLVRKRYDGVDIISGYDSTTISTLECIDWTELEPAYKPHTDVSILMDWGVHEPVDTFMHIEDSEGNKLTEPVLYGGTEKVAHLLDRVGPGKLEDMKLILSGELADLMTVSEFKYIAPFDEYSWQNPGDDVGPHHYYEVKITTHNRPDPEIDIIPWTPIGPSKPYEPPVTPPEKEEIPWTEIGPSKPNTEEPVKPDVPDKPGEPVKPDTPKGPAQRPTLPPTEEVLPPTGQASVIGVGIVAVLAGGFILLVKKKYNK